ncbi:hypothetical protein BD289DRAFT_376298 [Coniella lustricola]|uniref:Histidine phosphatase superfamily n=1 Tax=Coniella lustricola TaxID=2025994 RepID=A0A2T2ZX27_9PEZI|nr:hypothetical protein BD289DRAFT_376298 [Coniella lustricola]
MGRAPAYVFVVRHGNRLDAANKQWHFSSPTPYDPPLTYSGWNQARATGQKIGEILRERESEDDLAATATAGEEPPKKRRKFKTVIHSSPFLRCVQTSIAISAGLASIPEAKSVALGRTSSTHSTTNSRFRPAMTIDLPPSDATPASGLPTPPDVESGATKKSVVEKAVLRLDAFLGEWLTPSYFESITAPPGSNLMLASAKANLLRKEDYSNNPNFAPYNNQNASQNWAPVASPSIPDSNNENNMSSLAGALRRAGRSDSVTSVTSNGESHLITGGAYIAPVPAYAISHNAEIPSGYVPHARDNCCDVDYQWDSMRGTLDWGDGGALGEEWSDMHKRFRKGLQKMVDWYSTAEKPSKMVTKNWRAPAANDDDEEDDDVETVVIIVSHGAGCNALIGAITHQPVLTDVGLASLTQAVRKPGVSEVSAGISNMSVSEARTASHPTGLVPIHQYYDLKLCASGEHLTARRSSRMGSIGAQAAPPSRGRLGSSSLTASRLNGNASSGLFSGDNGRTATTPAPLGTLRRDSGGASSRGIGRIVLNTSGLTDGGITVGSGMTSFTKAGAASLWSPLRNNLDTPDEDDDDDFLPNFGGFDAAGTSSTSVTKSKPVEETPNLSDETVSPRTNADSNVDVATRKPEEDAKERRPLTLSQLGSGAGGLWGSPKLIEDDISQDLSSPRKWWTLSER